MLYPLIFQPRFKERIWGGRRLAELYKKELPPEKLIGESWEIVDRPGDESEILNGPHRGRTLRWLMENHGDDLMGSAERTPEGRFPLLIKILDAQDKLSLQVHPPASLAKALNGEPKTEMWYVGDASSSAKIYAGLRRGVTKEEFESKLGSDELASCFHAIQTKKGDSIFIPSGRVHALGAGNVIFEIQQNSDTTYRVYDWNRADNSGKLRQLHIKQSLASIDFQDFEPSLNQNSFRGTDYGEARRLAEDPLFTVELRRLKRKHSKFEDGMVIVGVVEGKLHIHSTQEVLALDAGGFCLIPASAQEVSFEGNAEFLWVTAGQS